MPMVLLPRRLSMAVAVLALSFLFDTSGFAQISPKEKEKKSVPLVPAPEEEAPARNLVTIEFGGGELSSYVDLLREKFDVNVVLGSEARELPMPPLSLKRVSLDTAMNLIGAMSRSLSGEAGAVEVKTIGDPEGNSVYMIDLISHGVGPAAPMGQMAPTSLGMPGQPFRPAAPRGLRTAAPGAVQIANNISRTVQVFSIKLLTQPVSGRNDLAIQPENVLTAIDTALGLSPGEEAAQVKYHEETGLIFVHGSPAQIEAVSTLIKTLTGDQIELQRSVPSQDIQKLVEENKKLRQEVLALRAEIETLKEGQETTRTIPSRPSRTPPLGGVNPSKN